MSSESKASHASNESFDDVHRPGPASPSRQDVRGKVKFYVNFLDGYSFRQLYDILKMTLTFAPLKFTAEGITIRSGNGMSERGSDTTFVAHVVIPRKKLQCYEFNPQYASHPEEGAHYVNFDLGKLRSVIKSTARKEGIIMYQLNDSNDIRIQTYGGVGSKSGEGFTTISTKKFEKRDYDDDLDLDEETEPNCRYPLASFCHACNQISKIRGEPYAEILTFPRGVIIRSCGDMTTTRRQEGWGEIPTRETREMIMPGGMKVKMDNSVPRSDLTTRVPIGTIKALSKLFNLVSNCFVNIYSDSSRLVTMEVPLSYYGILKIYLIDAKA